MKKTTLIDLGGLLAFYGVIIIGVLLLNMRFSYINEISNKIDNTYIAMNE